MKRTIITAMLVALATPTLASDFTPEERQRCETISEVAKTVMDNRQSGVSMRRQMEAIASDDGNELFEKIIAQAYRHPNYQTPEITSRTVGDFSDRWYRLCYDALKGED